MLAQMAATAGSVAVGSTIGHGLSSMLFGGSSSHAAEPVPVAQAAPAQQTYQSQSLSCEVQAKGKCHSEVSWPATEVVLHSDFTKCLEKADLPSCTWYLEQLKAVRALALLFCHLSYFRYSARLPLLLTRLLYLGYYVVLPAQSI
jgi:coiled-coil-helix-coiled-coil-helix domain-containing protein 2